MKLQTLKFWCQSVLPLVYDESLSYYEVLCKIVERINTMQEQINSIVDNADSLETKIDKLESYVIHYFENLDIDNELTKILMKMYNDGEFTSILSGIVGRYSTPIFVDRMNDMQDTNRIYVLTTTKHIYQSVNGVFFDTGISYGNGDTINVEYSGSGIGNNLNLRTVTVE